MTTTIHNIAITEHATFIHITFDINSHVNCYREQDGDYTWINSIVTAKAVGLKIKTSNNIDYSKLEKLILEKTKLDEIEAHYIISKLKAIKRKD